MFILNGMWHGKLYPFDIDIMCTPTIDVKVVMKVSSYAAPCFVTTCK